PLAHEEVRELEAREVPRDVRGRALVYVQRDARDVVLRRDDEPARRRLPREDPEERREPVLLEPARDRGLARRLLRLEQAGLRRELEEVRELHPALPAGGHPERRRDAHLLSRDRRELGIIERPVLRALLRP